MIRLCRTAVGAVVAIVGVSFGALALASTAPAVVAVSPAILPSAGGSVAVTGSGLSGAQSVTIGQVTIAAYPCPSPSATDCFTPVSDTTLTVQLGTTSAGTRDVVVATAGGSSTMSTGDELTVAPPVPQITSISSISGRVVGGQTVTLRGDGLSTPGSGPVEVDFGAVRVPITVSANNSVTLVLPRGLTGTADVRVVVQSDDGTVGRASPAGAVTFDLTPPSPGPIRWLPMVAPRQTPTVIATSGRSQQLSGGPRFDSPPRSEAWPATLWTGLDAVAGGGSGRTGGVATAASLTATTRSGEAVPSWPGGPDGLLQAWSISGLWNGPLDLTALFGGVSPPGPRVTR